MVSIEYIYFTLIRFSINFYCFIFFRINNDRRYTTK